MRLVWWAVLAGSLCQSVFSDDLGRRKAYQARRAIAFLLANAIPADSRHGTIIASPKSTSPNYYRHWVRDGALVANIMISLWEKANTTEDRDYYESLLWDYVDISQFQQLSIESPVFEADGTPITSGWGLPQRDGPALRSIVMMRFAHILLNQGRNEEVQRRLSRAGEGNAVIQADLWYLLNHGDYGFDIWEEVRGRHFYTKMVLRKAYKMGVHFADRIGDEHLKEECLKKLPILEASLREHVTRHQRGFIETSLDSDDGIDYKYRGRDIQTILGVLHGDTGDGFYGVSNEYVLATVVGLENDFRELYPINWGTLPGLAIGRYFEDRWDGHERDREGNPWLLATEAMGEFYERLASEVGQAGLAVSEVSLPFWVGVVPGLGLQAGQRIDSWDGRIALIVRALQAKADGYFDRVLFHSGTNGDFNEQFNRHNGFPQGPARLTWSCAALIVGHWHRLARLP